MTIRDMMADVEACTTKEQATELVDRYTGELLEQNPLLPMEVAKAMVLSNIGYLSGYYSRREAAKILALFGTKHPYLGYVCDWPEDPNEIVRRGMELGRMIAR